MSLLTHIPDDILVDIFSQQFTSQQIYGTLVKVSKQFKILVPSIRNIVASKKEHLPYLNLKHTIPIVDDTLCNWAAGNGHLEVLQWARTNGCPWISNICKYAKTKEIKDWIRQQPDRPCECAV